MAAKPPTGQKKNLYSLQSPWQDLFLSPWMFFSGNIPVPVNFRDFRSFILTKKTYILIGSGCFLNAGLFFGLWWCDLLNGVLKPPDY